MTSELTLALDRVSSSALSWGSSSKRSSGESGRRGWGDTEWLSVTGGVAQEWLGEVLLPWARRWAAGMWWGKQAWLSCCRANCLGGQGKAKERSRKEVRQSPWLFSWRQPTSLWDIQSTNGTKLHVITQRPSPITHPAHFEVQLNCSFYFFDVDCF